MRVVAIIAMGIAAAVPTTTLAGASQGPEIVAEASSGGSGAVTVGTQTEFVGGGYSGDDDILDCTWSQIVDNAGTTHL
jgi:hypothetical protein